MNSLKKPHWRLLLDPGHFLSFGFGSGLSPFAPGTLGTILAIPIALLMNQTSLGYRITLLSFLIVLGIYLCGRSATLFKEHDHSSIVFDEIVGMLVPLLFIPLTVRNVLFCFCLFRFFDILKPFPINLVDNNIKNGFGVMFDDVIAGIFSTIILYLLFMWI